MIHAIMHSVIWRSITAFLLLFLVLYQFNSIWGNIIDVNARYASSFYDDETTSRYYTPSAIPDGWSFDWRVDGENHGLSEAQCDSSFPDLYTEIDRASKAWNGRTLTPSDLKIFERNEGGVRVLLVDQQIRVLNTKGMERKDFRSRIRNVLQQLQRAVDSSDTTTEPLPTTEFSIVVDDFATLDPENANNVAWSFVREMPNPRQDNIWLIPDFNFWNMPALDVLFGDVQRQARTHDCPIAEKKQQIVWRGVAWTAPKLRGDFLNVTYDQPWADVKEIDWHDQSRANFLDVSDLCDYAFVANTEGRSWSSRLTYLLNCDSVPVSHPLRWATHYTHLLKPFENYLPTERDFSDLGETLRYYIADKPAAQKIADTARMTFRERYTTPAASACYWRRLLRSWAAVAYEPETRVIDFDSDDRPSMRVRGISVEDFLLINSNRDYHDSPPVASIPSDTFVAPAARG